jgi:tryptophanyl-tRNA synthetase
MTTGNVLTGDRPTGALHIGHYKGSLESRLDLQDKYPKKSFILIADQQALTDNFENPEFVRQNVLKVYACYLAVGIDPTKTTVFIQSLIPELYELTAHLMNFVTNNQLLSNPTLKEEAKKKGYENLPTGFFTYPVSQIADIVGMRGNLVPVGEDQLPHLEFCNNIVRRFNRTYQSQCLLECKPVVSEVSRLVGTDGNQKMGKSTGNAIFLNYNPDEILAKVMSMYTDPNHTKVEMPGNADNPVFNYLETFHPDQLIVEEMKLQYTKGGLGDVKVKKVLNEVMQEFIAPIRTRYEFYMSDPAQLLDMLKVSSKVAQATAQEVVADVRKSMFIDY